MIALNRIRQLRELDVPVPELNHSGGTTYCAIDRIRPGLEDSQERKISASVKQRQNRGREVKRQIGEIIRTMGLTRRVRADLYPTRDLGQLTGRDRVDALQPLSNKMAVLHIDGNRFSAIEDKAARRNRVRLREWDQFLRERRGDFFERLAAEVTSGPSAADWQVQDEKGRTRHRVEILLWGGDELTLAVPAWKGWETVKHYFEMAGGWEFGGVKLTHAAGVVFCHHNAPIREVVLLARQLVERAKVYRSERERHEDTIAYQVLESFDYLGDDFVRVRSLRRPFGLCEEEMFLTPFSSFLPNSEYDRDGPMIEGGEHDTEAALTGIEGQERGERIFVRTLGLNELIDERIRLGSHVPRRRLHEIAQRLLVGDASGYQRLLKRMTKLLPRDEAEEAQDSGRSSINEKVLPFQGKLNLLEEAAAWIHLIDLWDYLLPIRPSIEFPATRIPASSPASRDASGPGGPKESHEPDAEADPGRDDR